MDKRHLPVPSSDAALARYLDEVHRYPLLEAGEEYDLAKRWRDDGDKDAAHRLVTSHLRLVTKIAFGFRGYGLAVADLIAEGNIGLMQAVKRFEPEKGFRLSTYAMWWIKASIQEYILRSWSLVKIGTSSAQKKLFFNLRRLKHRLQAFSDGALTPENVEKIAHDLGVSEKDVADMDARLYGGGLDQSLHTPLGYDDDGREWIDQLASDEESFETRLVAFEETKNRRQLMAEAMDTLNDRERAILHQRRLTEPPATLEDLSQQYGISRERVRQIEVRAFEKLQAQMLAAIEAPPQRPLLAHHNA